MSPGFFYAIPLQPMLIQAVPLPDCFHNNTLLSTFG